ncbi:MAG TPA: universal stress protein [Candidatus Binatia bacterium]|nr:universal stress protein [Candidatus Binatia bacterium]
MYRRILVPLDGSKVAEQVLPYARSLAGSLKLPVELLRVVDLMFLTASSDAARAHSLDNIIEEGARGSKEYLDRVARSFTGMTVTCSVEKGSPADVIIEKGASDVGTLIAMATHGRSGIDRWLLGSVAEKVLRATANPLLLVRAKEEGKTDGEVTFKSIIVPLDGSKLAETVLPAAIELAKRLNLEIILLRAYALPAAVYATADDFYIPDYEELKAEIREEASAYLQAKVTELRSNGLEKVSSVLLEGPAAEEIIDFARTAPDSLVAMCSHGRSGLKRWILGSVSERVVRHSGNPVLVIRGQKDSQINKRKTSPARRDEAESLSKSAI